VRRAVSKNVTITRSYFAEEGQRFDVNLADNEWKINVEGWDTAVVTSRKSPAGSGASSFAAAVLTVRRSADGFSPVALETATTIGAGPGMSAARDIKGVNWLHVVLTTLEGSAGYADLEVTLTKTVAN
jgi:hypothetical protein